MSFVIFKYQGDPHDGRYLSRMSSGASRWTLTKGDANQYTKAEAEAVAKHYRNVFIGHTVQVRPMREVNPKRTLRQERDAAVDPFVRKHFRAFVKEQRFSRTQAADAWRVFLTDPEHWQRRGWQVLFNVLRDNPDVNPKLKEPRAVALRSGYKAGKAGEAAPRGTKKRTKNPRRGYLLLAKNRGWRIYRYVGANKFSRDARGKVFTTRAAAEREGLRLYHHVPHGMQLYAQGPISFT